MRLGLEHCTSNQSARSRVLGVLAACQAPQIIIVDKTVCIFDTNGFSSDIRVEGVDLGVTQLVAQINLRIFGQAFANEFTRGIDQAYGLIIQQSKHSATPKQRPVALRVV